MGTALSPRTCPTMGTCSRSLAGAVTQQRGQKDGAEDMGVPPCPWWLLRAERCSAPAPFPSPAPSSHRHQGTLQALNIQFPSPSPPCEGVQHGNEPHALRRRDLSGRRLLRASLPQKSPEVATGAAGAHPHGLMPPSPLLSCASPCCNTGFSPPHISPQAWIRPGGVPVPPGSRDSGDRWMAAGRGGCRSEAGTASCTAPAAGLRRGQEVTAVAGVLVFFFFFLFVFDLF